MEDYIVRMYGITKEFPGTLALDHVDFKLKAGEVLSILGENGAGKTTLMKILYGMHQMDSGKVVLRGKEVHLKNPTDAIKNGICMVHQHFMLISDFTVIENIIVGSEPGPGIFLNTELAAEQVRNLIDEFEFDVEPNVKVAKLSVGERQRVEILKALYRDASIIILDEPTAILTPREADALLKILDRLRKSGKSIVIVTHKLQETKAIADRVMVLRDGKLVCDDVDPQVTTFSELSNMMVGREIDFDTINRSKKIGEVLFSVEDLVLKQKDKIILDHISLNVRRGEILGIAGVEGNGQSELLKCITGLIKPNSMQMKLAGEILPPSAGGILKKGIAHIPEDRSTMGLIGNMSIEDNLILGYQNESDFQKCGFLTRKKNPKTLGSALQGIWYQNAKCPITCFLFIWRKCAKSDFGQNNIQKS